MTTYTADASPAQQIEALNTTIECLLKTISALREATKATDTVYCWPAYRLGVRLIDGKPEACDLSEATPAKDVPVGAVFRNGAGTRAELCQRSVVAAEALKTYTATLDWAQQKRCSLIARVLPSIVEG